MLTCRLALISLSRQRKHQGPAQMRGRERKILAGITHARDEFCRAKKEIRSRPRAFQREEILRSPRILGRNLAPRTRTGKNLPPGPDPDHRRVPPLPAQKSRRRRIPARLGNRETHALPRRSSRPRNRRTPRHRKALGPRLRRRRRSRRQIPSNARSRPGIPKSVLRRNNEEKQAARPN